MPTDGRLLAPGPEIAMDAPPDAAFAASDDYEAISGGFN